MAEPALFVFRADASLRIGNGHVMRCLALANALKARGNTCVFVCRALPGNLGAYLQSFGHELCLLPEASEPFSGQAEDPQHAEWLGVSWQTDAAQTLAALAGRRADCLVVDHYALDSRWERTLRAQCQSLFVLDDLADRPHDCDVLLDQTLGRSSEAYAGSVAAQCRLLLGAEFALLRPEFAQCREQSLLRRQGGELKHVLVSMGGVDPDSVTSEVLQGLRASSLPSDCRITVVLGANAPHLAQVRADAESMPWPTAVQVNVADMAGLMAECDLAIGAAGSSAWERCCLGLPSVLKVLADNQREVAAALKAAGAAHCLDESRPMAETLPHALAQLMQPGALQEMSKRAACLIDGKGLARVVAHIPGGEA